MSSHCGQKRPTWIYLYCMNAMLCFNASISTACQCWNGVDSTHIYIVNHQLHANEIETHISLLNAKTDAFDGKYHQPYCISFRKQFVDCWAIVSKILCWCYLMIWPFPYTYRALKCDDSRMIGIFGVARSNWTLCYERNRQNCTMYSIFHSAAAEFPLRCPNLRRWQSRLVYLVCVVSLACNAKQKQRLVLFENFHCTKLLQ